jgi:hypothetical protein
MLTRIHSKEWYNKVISHLFFADDVLVFAKATTTQARVISEVLNNLCATSNLTISNSKSRFYMYVGGSRHTRENNVGCSQIQATDKIDKYVGFKMFHGKVRKKDYSDVYDRISSKLASWKNIFLNKLGRVVLANSVISSLPSYHM